MMSGQRSGPPRRLPGILGPSHGASAGPGVRVRPRVEGPERTFPPPIPRFWSPRKDRPFRPKGRLGPSLQAPRRGFRPSVRRGRPDCDAFAPPQGFRLPAVTAPENTGPPKQEGPAPAKKAVGEGPLFINGVCKVYRRATDRGTAELPAGLFRRPCQSNHPAGPARTGAGLGGDYFFSYLNKGRVAPLKWSRMNSATSWDW